MCSKVFCLLVSTAQGREARPDRDGRAALNGKCPLWEAAVFSYLFFTIHYLLMHLFILL